MAATPPFMLILSIVLLGSVAAQNCPDSSLSLSISMKLMSADILLYGQDVTSPDASDCRGDTGNCNHRQIQFNVHCILVNRVNAPIGQTITIGTNPPENCDGTFFTFDETNDMLVVMVTYNATSGLFDWDEVVPGAPAKFLYTESLQEIIEQDTCMVADWSVPSNAVAGATCPTGPPYSCPGLSFGDENNLYIQYRGEDEGYIGSICCRAVYISPSYGWLSGMSQSVTSTQLKYKPTLVSFMSGMEPGTLYTVVAYMEPAELDMNHVPVTWLAINVPYEDTFLTEDGDVTELIPYMTPAPRQRDGTNWVFTVYKQSTTITGVNVMNYIRDDCTEECFKLDDFRFDQGLSDTMMSVTVKVNMDSFSLWQLYFNENLVHAEVCRMWDIDIEVYWPFAVCPAPEMTGSANSLSTFSALVLALALSCHLLALHIH